MTPRQTAHAATPEHTDRSSAEVAYDHLGEHWTFGLATSIALDIALYVALSGG